ncbi:MAG TPA: prepilin-type N-terminal cleavage/methylation domain-containing protein [Gemmatimonadaceae bacterium]|nr:prepilin-type N-terminal cleavage/methylation domain-containing protein [Gemmatimonadaceae bacterium]
MLVTRVRARDLRARGGFTLVEVSISLVLGALVLGLVFAIGSRLGNHLRGETDRLAVGEQLAAAAEVLPIDLRGLSAVAGDIAFGEARDSSLQLRQTIANALVCGATPSTWTVAPYLAVGGRSVTLGVQDGDTAWLLTDGDAGEQWRPVRLRAARRISGGCSILTDPDGAKVFDVAHPWAVDLRDSVLAIAGAMIRVTRPIRFSFYRASDGHWYLGLRASNSSSGAFNGVQPVSGPYAPVGARGTRFVYFDSNGAPVAPSTPDTRGIARIEAVLHAEATDTASARDSLTVVAALRNKP